MASLSFRKFFARRRFAWRAAALCLGGIFVLGAPSTADAACVAAALNKNGKQIKGTRSITHGVFPKIVCYRAVRHCERRLNELRYETGRKRRHARCEVIASGPRAAEIFGPPLEGWRARPGDPPRDDYAYRGDDDRGGDYRRDDYPDDYRGPHDLGEPGGHDGWRSAERDERYREPRYDDRRYEDRRYDDRRYDGSNPPLPDDRAYEGGDPLIDDLLRDERQGSAPRDDFGPDDGFRPDDRFGPDDRFAGEDRYTPYDREARSCNVDACAARYKTFRASDCTYKPTLYERRFCPL